MDQLPDDVRAVIAGELMLDAAGITDTLGPGDVARWDSVGHLLLVRAIERRFEIFFTVADVMSLTCVGDVIAAVRARLARRDA
jgi:acyl carrier protein